MGNENDNKVPDLKKEIKTEESDKGRSNQRSNKKGKRKGNNRRGKKKGTQKSTSQSTFKGSINDMNGHVFECYRESQTMTQFTRTCKELQSYATIHYKNGSDIQYTIRHFSDIVMTEPNDVSENATATQKRIWEKSVDHYVMRLERYRQNKDSLYAVIWAQCSSAMQAKLKTVEHYEKMDENLDCLELLKAIKGIAYKFETQGYIYLSLDDAKSEFYSYKQGRYESNSDYLTKFKSMLEVITHYGGNFGNDLALVREEMKRNKMKVSSLSIPGNSSYDKMISKAQERACALAFIKRADKHRYGALLVDLLNNYTRGNDQYPDNMTTAYNLLINYKTQHVSKKHQESDSDEDDVCFLNNVANKL
jgi:hypothetical protein